MLADRWGVGRRRWSSRQEARLEPIAWLARELPAGGTTERSLPMLISQRVSVSTTSIPHTPHHPQKAGGDTTRPTSARCRGHESVTMLSATAGIASRSSLHATDSSQVADEVFSSVIAMRACEENLAKLIALSREHTNLLAKRPADSASVERTIQTAWADLLAAKPVLERCGRGDKTALRHRLRWKMVDRKKYRLLATSVSKNDADVQSQIENLERIVSSNPLEVLTEAAREEESRRRREIDQVRTRREIDGLSILDPFESPTTSQARTSETFLHDGESASPELSETIFHPPYILPAGATPRNSIRSATSFTETWSRDSMTPTSNPSIATFSASSTLTGSPAPITRNIAGLLALGPDETPF